MNLLKITRLEPCEAVSFHIERSIHPEDEVFAQFHEWSEAKGLLEKLRFVPVLGFNNPWGSEGNPRGYEILCFLAEFEDIDLSNAILKNFPGGLFAVTTIPGLDVIPEYAQRLRRAVDSHPRYATSYPENYRHGVDPSPELEMVYTPQAQRPEDFILDYFIPIKEIAQRSD
ncbi:MAG: GyrI-like domain-containing protein [Proteobacteria bacterium]|nr:GyrI-like domain-containing protein [Pseudomonadota bacterium]